MIIDAQNIYNFSPGLLKLILQTNSIFIHSFFSGIMLCMYITVGCRESERFFLTNRSMIACWKGLREHFQDHYSKNLKKNFWSLFWAILTEIRIFFAQAFEKWMF